MFYQNALSTEPVVGTISYKGTYLKEPLADYSTGGIALQDPSMGLNVRSWRFEAAISGNNTSVALFPEDNPTAAVTALLIPGAISRLAGSFDRNMRYTIAYVLSGVLYLYWYDSLLQDYTTTALGQATDVVVTHDDYREGAENHADVIVSYIRGIDLKMRLQRDRYGIEYQLSQLSSEATRIVRFGMSNKLRLQWEFAGG